MERERDNREKRGQMYRERDREMGGENNKKKQSQRKKKGEKEP